MASKSANREETCKHNEMFHVVPLSNRGWKGSDYVHPATLKNERALRLKNKYHNKAYIPSYSFHMSHLGFRTSHQSP